VTSAATRIRSVIDVPVRAVTEMRSGKMAEEDQSVITMAMQGIVALDAPMGDGTQSFMDALVSADLTPEETAAAESLHQVQRRLIESAMTGLNDEEAEVIRRRKLQPVPETLEELADAMEMSRDRLRQVERRAMTRLRRFLLDNGFHKAMLN
jgi:RNA polymerase sigma factor (sigma-70 family)